MPPIYPIPIVVTYPTPDILHPTDIPYGSDLPYSTNILYATNIPLYLMPANNHIAVNSYRYLQPNHSSGALLRVVLSPV